MFKKKYVFSVSLVFSLLSLGSGCGQLRTLLGRDGATDAKSKPSTESPESGAASTGAVDSSDSSKPRAESNSKSAGEPKRSKFMDDAIDLAYARELSKIAWPIQRLRAVAQGEKTHFDLTVVRKDVEMTDELRMFAANCQDKYASEFGKKSMRAIGEGTEGLSDPSVPCAAVDDLDDKILMLWRAGASRYLAGKQAEFDGAIKHLEEYGTSSNVHMARLHYFDDWLASTKQTLSVKVGDSMDVDVLAAELEAQKEKVAPAFEVALSKKRQPPERNSRDATAVAAVAKSFKKMKVHERPVRLKSTTLTTKWAVKKNRFGRNTHRYMLASVVFAVRGEPFCRRQTFSIQQEYISGTKLDKNVSVQPKNRNFQVIRCP